MSEPGWRLRSGFPLTSYKAEWESLQAIPKNDTTETSQSGSVKLSDTVFFASPQTEYRLKRLTNEYLFSYSDPDKAAKNHHVHNSKRLLKNRQLSKYNFETLAGILLYRINSIIARATEYKYRSNIAFENCKNIDISSYITAVLR